jgi:predicted flap endonuclease-1-like 5' DNA nuclease
VEDIMEIEAEDAVGHRALQNILNGLPPHAYAELSQMLQDEVQGEDRAWAIEMIQAKMDEQQTGLDEKREISYSNSSDLQGDLQRLPGVGKVLEDALKADGYETIDDVLSLGVEGLKNYPGIGELKAWRIIEAAKDLMEE